MKQVRRAPDGASAVQSGSARRARDWPSRLAGFIDARRQLSFAWWENDCFGFASQAWAAQGLPDPRAQQKPYKTARGALSRQRALGGSLDAVCEALMPGAGGREVAPAFAGRGALVIADIPVADGDVAACAGIVDLDGRRALFPSAVGLKAVPVAKCRRAWRCG